MFLLFFIVSLHLFNCYASINSRSSKFTNLAHKDYFDESGACFQKAVACQPLQNATCFGTSLPYAFTSIDLVDDSRSQFEIQANLARWQALRSVPRCWAIIQPLLCASYMPKCENGSIFLPSQEMCRLTRVPCKIVEDIRSWPSFLQCDNKKLFPSRCRNPLQEIKFNTSYKCISPLVETDNPDNWFYKIEGCGIQCQNPLYTEKDHAKTHHIIKILAFLSLSLTSFAMITFIMNWKSYNRYPEKIIFYILLCLTFVSFGCIVQFIPGAREEIVCNHDGTVRQRQPKSGQHLCSITFVLIYYFLMATIIWVVILTYAWYAFLYETLTGRTKTLKKRGAYFHICAWCIPLVLTVITMAINGVDGDSMSGVCFVGFSIINIRLMLVLFPAGVATLVGGSFLSLFVYNLVKVKLQSGEAVNELSRKKILHKIYGASFFAVCTVAVIIITFCCHAYEFINRHNWNDSLKAYILCRAMHSYSSKSSFHECKLESKPNALALHSQLCCLPIFSVMVSSLILWSTATLETWKRFFYRFRASPEKKSRAPKKSELIALAFNHRDKSKQGNYSITSVQEDPLDVRRYISVDSFNQQNMDSSMQISEQEFHEQNWRQRRKTKKERERLLRANPVAPWFPGHRRGSDTSHQSSFIAAAVSRNAMIGVTKSTSTGDLERTLVDAAVMSSFVVPQPRHRNLIQHAVLYPPPFTHGMSEVSNRLDFRSAQRFTPIPSNMPTPLPGMIRPPLYSQYDLMNSINMGFGGIYSAYPRFSSTSFPAAYNVPYFAYTPTAYQSMDTISGQPSLIPLHPRADSASETEYLPIILSDSELTDTGFRSYDEAQVLTTQRLMQERLQAQLLAKAKEEERPVLESQASQFLQTLKAEETAKNSRPSFGRKSHSSAPPPSPADLK